MSSTSSDFAPSKLEDLNVTNEELNSIGEALKKEEFRKLLCDYVQEIQNPENRKIYEEELTLLEKQRGVDVTFVTPKACFVVKTSSNGNVKTFINICSNENVGVPTSSKQGQGLNWQVPYVLAPPRLDYDKNQEKCNVYDVVFHPQSIELGNKSKNFKQLLLDTALNGIEQNFKVSLDKVNLKFPNLQFKGSVHPTVLRKKSKTGCINIHEETEENGLVQKSYSQHDGPKTELKTPNTIESEEEKSSHYGNQDSAHNSKMICDEADPLQMPSNFPYPPLKENKAPVVTNLSASRRAEFTTPSYVVKEYSEVSMDAYRNDKFCKADVTIPSKLIVEIQLPLLKTMEFTKLDIRGRQFDFASEKPSKYRLSVRLPYAVDEESGSAKFEVDKKLLVVTLPVVYGSEQEGDTREIVDQVENCSDGREGTENGLKSIKIREEDKGVSEQGETMESYTLHQAPTEESSALMNQAMQQPIRSTSEIDCTNQSSINTENTESNVHTESSFLEVTDRSMLNVITDDKIATEQNEPFSDHSLKSKVRVEEIKTLPSESDENKALLGMSEHATETSIVENTSTTTLEEYRKNFFSSKVFFTYPEHVLNARGKQLVFVFHVNNVDKETIEHLLIQERTLLLQFVSVGSGFYRSHFGVCIRFDHPVRVLSISPTANTVIVKLDCSGCLNRCYYVTNVPGGDEVRRTIPEPEYFMHTESDDQESSQFSSQEPSTPQTGKSSEPSKQNVEQLAQRRQSKEDVAEFRTAKEQALFCSDESASVELSEKFGNMSCERKTKDAQCANTKVSANGNELELSPRAEGPTGKKCGALTTSGKVEDEDKENQKAKGMEIPKSKSTSSLCVDGYRVRGILKTCSRSLSLSSDEEDEEHYSSSCSVKKHVRFDEHISRKLFSTKCTILEQEKKYQKRLRHASHKRERRVSETEASDTETGRKHLSKKAQKKQNRHARNTTTKSSPGTPDCVTETSEEETKSSASATSESGGETSGDSDCGRECSGDVIVLASRKGHRRRGKKNARRMAADWKGDRGVFMMDVN